jgi:hypothetical protein
MNVNMETNIQSEDLNRGEKEKKKRTVKKVKKVKKDDLKKDRESLIKDIRSWMNVSSKKKEKNLLKDELVSKTNAYKHDKEYYRNLVFFSTSETVVEDLDLHIVFCNKDSDLLDIWKYFKSMTSSAHTQDNGFGYVKSMILDKKTQKYIGIIEISYDIFNCGTRDEYIGWTYQNKQEKVFIETGEEKARCSFLVNITCCVGLQPMSYNLNIGKLLVAAVFSREMQEYFHELRGYYYAGVTTFGLNGKSVQYDRLQEIKNIGMTKGMGTSFFPDELYQKIRIFLKKHDPNEFDRHRKMSSAKMRLIEYALKFLDMDSKAILTHGSKRGIYFGFTGLQSKDFFCGKRDDFELGSVIRPFEEIVSWWKERWAKKRYEHLMKNNLYKIHYDWKDYSYQERRNQYLRQVQFVKRKDVIYMKNKRERERIYYLLRKKKKESNIEKVSKKEMTMDHKIKISKKVAMTKRNTLLTDEVIKDILKMKDENKMQKDVIEKYGIKRHIVRQIWNKELLALDDPEYESKKKERINTKEKEEEENQKSRNEKTSMGLRSVSKDVYINILKWRKKMIEKELHENKKITYPLITKQLQNTFPDKKITINIVKNVATGLTKMYQSDFEDVDGLNYEEYMKIIL